MKRKVVLHGPSTLTVSLPTTWVKKFNIKKGDELEVEEQGRELKISTERDFTLDKKEFNIGDLEKLVRVYITSSYVQGCDEISIKYKDISQVEKIRDFISRELIGFEIVKQNKDGCLIKNLATPNKDEFNIALRRIFLLLIDFSDECLDAIQKDDTKRLKNMWLMDCNINKFTNYCLRLLTKTGHINHKKIPLYYYFVKSLEEIADRYEDLCKFHLNNNKKASKEFISILKEINNHLNEFYNLFYKYDEKKIEILISELKLVNNKILNSKEKLSTNLHSIYKDIRDLLSALIEINM